MASVVVAREEESEAKLAKLETDLSFRLAQGNLSQDRRVIDIRRTISESQESLVSIREESLQVLKRTIDQIQREEE